MTYSCRPLRVALGEAHDHAAGARSTHELVTTFAMGMEGVGEKNLKAGGSSWTATEFDTAPCLLGSGQFVIQCPIFSQLKHAPKILRHSPRCLKLQVGHGLMLWEGKVKEGPLDDPLDSPQRKIEDRKRERKRKRTMAAAEQVKASHILIKHQGSRRKASWKDPDGQVISATTRDAAVSQLLSLREDIVSGKARFQDVAARYSDCSSAKRGGDLGRFGRGQMQKPFEEATFALQVGQLSDIVDTDSGVHIILRTG
ncbi:hypothetical protein ZIOFF_024166 [Zingiber officinale]|uniref:Peptidyl-prolyl cis-trans isomerase n=2 Tax=Zingiber officinale TaxID=94328 RepID=A0A8J5LCY8_ZINOF|nr:hypothetical protein ZIOFF_024166 [Zingiber officinale]